MKFSHLPFLLISFLSALSVQAQDWIGYHTSNYAGVHAVQFNPALIAGNNYKLDISLIAGHVNVTNNYLYVNSATLTNPRLFTEPNFTDRYVTEKLRGAPKAAFMNLNIQAPSVMVRIAKIHAIAFAPRVRMFMNADNVDQNLAKLMYEELNYPPGWDVNVQNDYLGVNANAWAEYGLSYGVILYSDKVHVLKVGATAKLLQGLGSAYLNIRDYSYNFANDDTLASFRAEGNFGHSTNLDNLQFKYDFIAKPSFAFDIGIIYEYCPKSTDRNGIYRPKKYVRKTGIWADDQSKYLWKVGVSVNDIGRLRYEKSPNSRDFTANVSDLPLTAFDNISSVATLDQAINTNFTQQPDSGIYFMDLPLNITAFLDYRFNWGFAVNGTVFLALNNGKRDDHRNHYLTQVVITPRWEKKWFGAYLPIYVNQMGLVNFGLSLRMGPLVFGSGDILGSLIKRKYSSIDFHFGLRLIIPNKKDAKNAPVCPAYK